MKTSKILVAISIIIVILIPIALNFLLPIETGLKILGGDTRASHWLTFWGAYLAAIGSFAMAWVSVDINKRAVSQNKEILHYNTLDILFKRYDNLEKFIIHEELLYCNHYVDDLLSQIRDNTEGKKRIIAKHKKMCSISSLKITKFLEQEDARLYHNNTGKVLYQYGILLRDANDSYLAFLEELEKENCNLETFYDMNHVLIERINHLYHSIMKQGLVVLQEEKRRISDYIKKYGIETGLILY